MGGCLVLQACNLGPVLWGPSALLMPLSSQDTLWFPFVNAWRQECIYFTFCIVGWKIQARKMRLEDEISPKWNQVHIYNPEYFLREEWWSARQQQTVNLAAGGTRWDLVTSKRREPHMCDRHGLIEIICSQWLHFPSKLITTLLERYIGSPGLDNRLGAVIFISDELILFWQGS